MSEEVDKSIHESLTAALTFVRPKGDWAERELSPDEWQDALIHALRRAAHRERVLMWLLGCLFMIVLLLVVDPILDFLGPIIDVTVEQFSRLFSPG